MQAETLSNHASQPVAGDGVAHRARRDRQTKSRATGRVGADGRGKQLVAETSSLAIDTLKLRPGTQDLATLKGQAGADRASLCTAGNHKNS